jgi:hypothetical protein
MHKWPLILNSKEQYFSKLQENFKFLTQAHAVNGLFAKSVNGSDPFVVADLMKIDMMHSFGIPAF